MRFSAFVRIRPGGDVEPRRLRSDDDPPADTDPDVMELVALALEPFDDDDTLTV